MKKFKNRYRIPSARLKNWDYGSPGFYFVTICTKNRECYFGDIVETQNIASQNMNAHTVETQNIASQNMNAHTVETQNIASLRPTKMGIIANQYWTEIPTHFPFVELDEYTIMPNHVHGILLINKPDYNKWKPNEFGPQSENLGSIIRGYKAGVKTFATTNQIEFYWQPRFYDHIIRSEEELNRIRQYIINNPMNWKKDMDNKEGLLM